MNILKPTKYERIAPDIPLALPFENFCDNLLRSYAEDAESIGIAIIAADFRRFFKVPSHVSPVFLRNLARRCGIEIVDVESLPDMKAFWFYNLRWEIHLLNDCPDMTTSLLHEIFELLFWRLHYRHAIWAKVFLESYEVSQCHQLADVFASEIILPRNDFQNQAETMYHNISTLARHYCVRPAQIIVALSRYLQPPCPIFFARLSFQGLPKSDQLSLDLLEERIQAIVWKQLLKKPKRINKATWQGVLDLRDKFPKQNSIVYVDNFIAQAVLDGHPQVLQTSSLIGNTLSKPIWVVVRPNGAERTQAFLYAVPLGYEHLLFDEALRAHLGEAIPFSMASPVC